MNFKNQKADVPMKSMDYGNIRMYHLDDVVIATPNFENEVVHRKVVLKFLSS